MAEHTKSVKLGEIIREFDLEIPDDPGGAADQL